MKFDPERLNYWKCPDCLTTCTIKEKDCMIQGYFGIRPAETACACGGKMEHMGYVTQSKWFNKTEEKCACDERCTHAQGPSCDCKCNGANHGTGMTIEIITETGKIRIKEISPEAIRRAEEFRAAKAKMSDTFNHRFGELYEKKRQGIFIDGDEYWAWQRAIATYNRACFGKIHSRRMKKINDLTKEWA
jgi:hypothetical protein